MQITVGYNNHNTRVRGTIIRVRKTNTGSEKSISRTKKPIVESMEPTTTGSQIVGIASIEPRA